MYKSNFGQSSISVIYGDFDITELTSSVEWSGDIKQASRTLTVHLSNTINGRNRLIKFEHGKEIIFYNGDSELFRGVLFSFDIDDKGNTILTAYDENTYLTKSVDTRKFTNKKASDIVKRLCEDFGITYGQIDDTGYVIPKLILRDRTLYEMIITALTVTEKQTGKRFFLTNKGGKLVLLERKEQLSSWVLENGSNIMSAHYSQSIEELKTKIKVIGGDSEKSPIVARVSNNELIDKYGIMQHLENVDSDLTKSQIEQRAKELMKQLGTIDDNASVDAIGIDDVIAGSAVYVYEQMTGIIGAYYVSSDSHTFENDKHYMSVDLSATDDLPTLEYNPPIGSTSSSSSTDGSTNLQAVLKKIKEMGA